MTTPVPLDNPDQLLGDILPVVTVRLNRLPFLLNSVEGTGFLLGDNLLVTCSHCVRADPPENCAYAACRLDQQGSRRGNLLGPIEHLGNDLAVGPIRFSSALSFTVADSPPRIGASVWTFGYPLTDVERITDEVRYFTAHPRLLRGHITRPFVYNHEALGPLPSWELSFPVPAGLSGAPLFLHGTLDVIGVVYGNNDVAAVEEFALVDQETGIRQPEVQRIVSFGLALHLEALAPLRDRLGKSPASVPTAG